MTASPFWIKRVEQAFEEETHIPLWGERLPFPWERLQQSLSKRLSLHDLHLEPAPAIFRTKEALQGDFRNESILLTFELAPLGIPVHWAMSKADMQKLVSWTLTLDSEHQGFSTPTFQEGFFRFLTLQILEEIDQLAALKGVSPHLTHDIPLPEEGALCLDLRILNENITLIGRMICPRPSLHALKLHWAKEPINWLKSPQAEGIPIRLHLDIGHVTLTLTEWNHLQIGDGIFPDRCTMSPAQQKGMCTLFLHKTPLFQARLREHSIKIVDFAFYEEISMNKESQESLEGESPKERNAHEEEQDLEEEHLWETPPEEKKEELRIASEEISLVLSLELGKLEITLGQLLKLQPGNALELPFHPEQGIDLVLHGKRIGRGELLQIGDSVVVRILEIFATAKPN